MPGLAEQIRGWSPPEVRTTGRLDAWPVAAFSALLDLPAPVAGPGEPLPALWHWLHLLEHPRQSELGPDGHPARGAFLPPLPDRRRMFAGGRVEVHRALRVDDGVERRSAVRDVQVRSGRTGEMVFVTVRHELRRAGELCVVDEQDYAYRSQPAGRARALPDGPAGVRPEPALTLTPDATTLFRFSALTYNTHRIHYDAPYATQVEGYPGLVVHGPLLALLLLEVPRRAGLAVSAFDYRLRRPVVAGQQVDVAAERTGTGWELVAGVPGEGDAVQGTARLRD